MITILNSSVLTNFGEYVYTPLTIQEVIALLNEEPFCSAIGHEEIARFLSGLTGIDIPANRIDYRQAPGDRAIVFKIKDRLKAGEILNTEEMELTEIETGLLVRTK